jgi:hypothetical protein
MNLDNDPIDRRWACKVVDKIAQNNLLIDTVFKAVDFDDLVKNMVVSQDT